MYKAPIEILSAKVAEYKLNTETMVMEAVFETGINVDKDELIRALLYDRDQYDKGFADGKAEAAEEIKVLKDELDIWKQDRSNIFQTTECYQRAQEKVARDIFEEIEKLVAIKIPTEITPIFKRGLGYSHGVIDGKSEALFEVLVLIAELKKKYTEDATDICVGGKVEGKNV